MIFMIIFMIKFDKMFKFLAFLCLLSAVQSVTVIRQGTQYKIKSQVDGLYVSTSAFTFRPDFGIYSGKLYLKNALESPSQVWDMIKWSPNGTLFWPFARANCLNELTNVPQDTNLPEKNLIAFIQIIESPEVFYIQSDNLKACLQNNKGEGLPLTYEKCDFTNRSQQWIIEALHEDE